jgi:hypothetical protein
MRAVYQDAQGLSNALVCDFAIIREILRCFESFVLGGSFDGVGLFGLSLNGCLGGQLHPDDY